MFKLADGISKVLEVMVVIVLAIMSVLVIVNVAMRFLLDSGIVMSEELSRYLFVWVVFLGAIVAMHRNAHIHVFFIRDAMPAPVAKAIKIIVDLGMLYCCYLLTMGSLEVAEMNMMDRSPVAGVPMGLVFYAATVGAVGMAFMLIVRLISYFAPPKDQDKA